MERQNDGSNRKGGSMTIATDPLMTDIFTMIRAKIGASTTMTGILGEYSPTDNMRVFRNHPANNVSYPRITMTRAGRDNESNRNTAIDYFIILSIYTNSTSHANEDIIERELLTIFGNPQTNFNLGETFVDEVEINGGGGQLWDESHRTWNLPAELRIRARRKNNVM